MATAMLLEGAFCPGWSLSPARKRSNAGEVLWLVEGETLQRLGARMASLSIFTALRTYSTGLAYSSQYLVSTVTRCPGEKCPPRPYGGEKV